MLATKMHKLSVLRTNLFAYGVRRLHIAEANVLQTSIDINSSEYQVKNQFLNHLITYSGSYQFSNVIVGKL